MLQGNLVHVLGQQLVWLTRTKTKKLKPVLIIKGKEKHLLDKVWCGVGESASGLRVVVNSLYKTENSMTTPIITASGITTLNEFHRINCAFSKYKRFN